MNICITKDGNGFTAYVEGVQNLFAHGSTEQEAKQELVYVIEMMMDIHIEALGKEREAKEKLLKNEIAYAV